MNFKIFINILYSYINEGRTQPDFVYDVLKNIIDEDFFKTNSKIIDRDSSTYNKWFNGDEGISRLFSSISNVLDKSLFAMFLDKSIKDDNTCNEIIRDFKKYDVIISMDNLVDDIADILEFIIKNKNAVLKQNKCIDNVETNKLFVANLEDIPELVEKPINKNLKVADDMLNNIVLPDVYKNNFELKRDFINGNEYFDIVPKNDEVLKKYPPHFNFSYNITNKTKIEIENIIEFNRIIKGEKEIYKPFKLPKPDEFSFWYGDLKNPLSPMTRFNTIEHYIIPKTFSVNTSIKVINPKYRIEYKNILLKRSYRDKNKEILDNTSSDYLFDVTLEIIKKNLVSLNYNVKLRDSKLNSVCNILEFSEFLYYFKNENSKIIVKNLEKNEIMINHQNTSKNKLDKNEEKTLEKEIVYLKKLRDIEDIIDISFDFDNNIFKKIFSLIDVVYNYAIRQNKRITGNTLCWYVLVDEIFFNTYEIGSKINGLIFNNIEITLFGKNIKLDNAELIFEKTELLNKYIKDDKYIIVIKPKNICINNIVDVFHTSLK